MNENAPIIDVTPLKHSSSRIKTPHAENPKQSRRGADSRASRPAATRTAWSPFATLAAIAQVIIGVLLMAIGVPMLVLPGPGLLSIGVGALLVARGVSALRPRRAPRR